MSVTPLSRAPSLLTRDRGLLWHPYAALDDGPGYAVTGAEGVWLQLEHASGSRHEVIDAMGSWWCAAHGYHDPELDAAISAQHAVLDHVMFGGLTHAPAVEVAERLVAITPDPLAHVFLADSGSVSVEVALKLAVQYQRARGRHDRHRFLALRGAYHGDTTGAMSVCDPVDGMHAAFGSLVSPQVFAPRPPAARRVGDALAADPAEVAAWSRSLGELLDRHGHELAGIIVEPILQGAGGMHVWAPECLRELRAVATQLDAVLIADEIATGFGRTGPRFAVDWGDVIPDVLCVGKALTGGTMTMAAVICSSDVAAAIGAGEDRALMHGPTFMGNPLACAAAAASLDLLERRAPTEVPRIERVLTDALAPASALPAVADVRVLGATGTVQLRSPADARAIADAAVQRGVWLRPFRDLVYTMPPYVTGDDDLRRIAAAMIGAIEQVHGR